MPPVSALSSTLLGLVGDQTHGREQGAMMSPELRGRASGTPSREAVSAKQTAPYQPNFQLGGCPPKSPQRPWSSCTDTGSQVCGALRAGTCGWSHKHTQDTCLVGGRGGKARISEEVRPQLSPEEGPGAPRGGKSSGEGAEP